MSNKKTTKQLWSSSGKHSMQAIASIFANKQGDLRPPVIYGARVEYVRVPVTENEKKTYVNYKRFVHVKYI